MPIEIENTAEFIINTVADFMFDSANYNADTAKTLTTVLCKNLRYALDNNAPASSAQINLLMCEARIKLFRKLGEANGHNPTDFADGIVGFDARGESIRERVITFFHSASKQKAEQAFDAGRRFARDHSIKL